MSATGIKQFTLAFMLSDGGCNPKWDGSMNGKTDEPGETVTTADFNTMLTYAKSHHIARFTFWSVNRDRQCTSGSDADACSGISQSPYAFTKIITQYHD
jgi:chitinase